MIDSITAANVVEQSELTESRICDFSKECKNPAVILITYYDFLKSDEASWSTRFFTPCAEHQGAALIIAKVRTDEVNRMLRVLPDVETTQGLFEPQTDKQFKK